MNEIDIQHSNNCANSPKNKLIEDFCVRLMLCEADTILELITADAKFSFPGTIRTQSAAELNRFLTTIPQDIVKVAFSSSISHGKHGTSFGYLYTKAGEKAFSIHLKFNSLKKLQIKEIVVFISKKIEEV